MYGWKERGMDAHGCMGGWVYWWAWVVGGWKGRRNPMHVTHAHNVETEKFC